MWRNIRPLTIHQQEEEDSSKRAERTIYFKFIAYLKQVTSLVQFVSHSEYMYFGGIPRGSRREKPVSYVKEM